MRLVLVSHGFPPHDRTGVENYTAALARTLAERGNVVHVFAPRRADLPECSVRLEERDGYAVHWLTANKNPADLQEGLERPGAAQAFGEFLDRERPDLVHFQHVVKLGVGLLSEARKRGIGVLYTAHDYYAVCHRYTLLRPDLQHCEIRGDSMACGLCDLGLEFLNEHEELGDYQMGVLEGQLADEDQARLTAILDDDADEAGIELERFDAAFDRRLELDAARARAFAAVDRFIAPTRFLSDELIRGGIERDRIQVLPYGIENADLARVPAVEFDGTRPLRFGFFGGLSKHKGVQLLVEAFGRLKVPAELSIWGYSTDRVHVERLREAAGAAGALWRGGYQREELPELVAEVDVVVVPSTWVENYPIVIREAFSARRPVIAWRFGALEESVRDGEDGLLVEAFDVEALSSAMERLAGDDQLVRKLVAGIEPVKTIEQQADELGSIYGELIASKESETLGDDESPSLASLAGFQARHRRVDALSTRELFAEVMGGLDRLRTGIGGEIAELPTGELLRQAFEAGAAVQDAGREGRSKNAWLEESLATTAEALAERVKECDWRGASLGEAKEAKAYLEGELANRDEELAWREGQVKSHEEELEWLRGLRGELEEKLAEAETERTELETERAALQTERAWLGELLVELFDQMDSGAEARPRDGETLPEVEGDRGSSEWLGTMAGRHRKSQRWISAELEWRREEMDRARNLSNKRVVRFLLKRIGLGRRLMRWSAQEAEGDAS